MSEDQKKVSLKIQFSNNKVEQPNPVEHRMVSQWNFGRIVTVVAVIVVLAIAAIYLTADSDLNKDKQTIAELKVEKPSVVTKAKQGEALPQKKSTKPLPVKTPAPVKVAELEKSDDSIEQNNQNTITSEVTPKTKTEIPVTVVSQQDVVIDKLPSGLLRSQLASGIWEEEPFGDVNLPIKVNGIEATGLFYFTELQGMQGQSIYHVWKRKGKIIFKQKKQIDSKLLKTHTSKLFTKMSIGSWTVSVTDSDLVPLHTIAFNVVAE